MANTIAVKAKSTDKKKSADYRHTLSWLTTSHNYLWEVCAKRHKNPNDN